MKRILSRILCMALMVCMLLTLAGCGVAGRYVLKEMSYSGISLDAETAGLSSDKCYIELKSDGTGVMSLNGKENDMEWKDGQIWIEGEEDNKVDFEIEDDALTLEIEGMKMIFEKE